MSANNRKNEIAQNKPLLRCQGSKSSHWGAVGSVCYLSLESFEDAGVMIGTDALCDQIPQIPQHGHEGQRVLIYKPNAVTHQAGLHTTVCVWVQRGTEGYRRGIAGYRGV